MNAAFLLVTASCFAGQTPTPVIVQVNHVHAAPASSCSSCATPTTSCCDPCGSEGFGHRLRGRLQGLFSRHSHCGDTCNTCAAPAPAPKCCAAPAPTCAPACAPTTSCDSCHGHSFNLFARLRAGFHKPTACCDAGCGTGCANGSCAPGAPPAAPEKLDTPPQKLPPAGGTEPPKKVQIDTPPIQNAPVNPNLQAAPANIQNPAIVPTVPSFDTRNPF